MIVEFVGLPASGKTTVAKSVFNECNSSDRSVTYPLYTLYEKTWLYRNIIKSAGVLSFAIYNPKKIINLLHIIYKANQSSYYVMFKLLFNFTYYMRCYSIHSKTNNIVIYDEGFIHNIWAVMYSSGKICTASDMKEFIRFGCLPDVIVKIDCEISTVLDRLLTRKSKTRIERDENTLIKLKHSKKMIDELVSEFIVRSNISGTKNTTLNNNEFVDLQKNTMSVIALIN